MAAEESIDSPASNDQSSLGFSGTVADETPVRPAVPRNCVQASGGAASWAAAAPAPASATKAASTAVAVTVPSDDMVCE